MGKLINIDNGGTLTDICVTDGDLVWLTKVLTTPFDLSHCLIEGLKKASTAIYGAEDLETLLLSTDHIRYSTTRAPTPSSSARARGSGWSTTAASTPPSWPTATRGCSRRWSGSG